MKDLYRSSTSFMASVVCLFACAVQGQVADGPDATVAGIPVNYTEAKVGNYTLPDPLQLNNGEPVKDARTWNEQRRPELLKYYQSEIYGRIPATAPKVTWQVVSNDDNALGGIAVMKRLAGHMGRPDGPAIDVTLYTPSKASKPVPILVSISFNFGGAGARGGRTRWRGHQCFADKCTGSLYLYFGNKFDGCHGGSRRAGGGWDQ